MQPMRWLNMQWRGSIFYSFMGEGEGVTFDFINFWSYHHVPNVFTTSSQCVSNSTILCPIIFAHSWTYITYKGGPKRSTSILLICEHPMFQFFLCDEQIMEVTPCNQTRKKRRRRRKLLVYGFYTKTTCSPWMNSLCFILFFHIWRLFHEEPTLI